MRGITDPVLAAAVHRDPVPAGRRRHSHLHVVAHPHDVLRLPEGAADAAIRATGRRVRNSDRVFPGWRQLTRREDRGAGTVGFSTGGLVDRRLRPDSEERDLLDVEIAQDGHVLLFCGRGSDRHTPTGLEVVIDGGIVTLTRSVATMAGFLGGSADYAGSWRLAVAVTDLAGRESVHAVHGPVAWRPPITAAGYTRVTDATTAHLLDHPEHATHRLVGPLLDALGTAGRYQVSAAAAAGRPTRSQHRTATDPSGPPRGPGLPDH